MNYDERGHSKKRQTVIRRKEEVTNVMMSNTVLRNASVVFDRDAIIAPVFSNTMNYTVCNLKSTSFGVLC